MRQRTLRTTAGACILFVVLGASGCESESYDVTEDLSYDSTIGQDGTFDFYQPRSDTGRANRPAILAIHEGAWRGGDKAWGEQFAEELCPFGYVVFSINYRVSSRPNGRWPAQIEDVQKASSADTLRDGVTISRRALTISIPFDTSAATGAGSESRSEWRVTVGGDVHSHSSTLSLVPVASRRRSAQS